MSATETKARASALPRISGHAPSDLRGAFLDLLDVITEWEPESERETTIEVRGHERSISELCDALQHCSDMLPSVAWEQVRGLVDDERKLTRCTYGVVARWLKDEIAPS